MMKKVVLSVSFALLTTAFALGQAAQTAAQRATAKSSNLAKYINVKVGAIGVATPDPKKKLSAAQEKGLKDAQLAYELGIDSLKAHQATLPKKAEDLKARVDAANGKVAADSAEAQKIGEEKTALAKEGEDLKVEADKLKARPEQLRSKLEADIRKLLKGEHLAQYEAYVAEQKAKAKKGS
jgi:hypothetical protein